ncbi:MAG: hypothetical protein SCI25_14235, partial [Desulfuromonadales bacterium]|nr:hypothetical protein [Desulfuromonadales bacterium]MDW7758984.1 hypothetical protein [Desulfuromonadales bacterium]
RLKVKICYYLCNFSHLCLMCFLRGHQEKEPKETLLFLLPDFAAAWYRLRNRPVESLVAPESEKPH